MAHPCCVALSRHWHGKGGGRFCVHVFCFLRSLQPRTLESRMEDQKYIACPTIFIAASPGPPFPPLLVNATGEGTIEQNLSESVGICGGQCLVIEFQTPKYPPGQHQLSTMVENLVLCSLTLRLVDVLGPLGTPRSPWGPIGSRALRTIWVFLKPRWSITTRRPVTRVLLDSGD